MAAPEQKDPAFRPLGSATPKPVEAIPPFRPTDTPGIVRLPDGKLATQLPLPKGAP